MTFALFGDPSTASLHIDPWWIIKGQIFRTNPDILASLWFFLLVEAEQR
jgi:hypothetical protein